MDVQRKKGILEVCVLAVLKKGPSYGYLIIRELEQCIDVSESTLYPILKRLEQNGSLRTYSMEYNGRMRKYYELTQEGQKKIDVFLGEWAELKGMYEFVQEQNSQQKTEPIGVPDDEVSEEAAPVKDDEISEEETPMPDAEVSEEATPVENDVQPAEEDAVL